MKTSKLLSFTISLLLPLSSTTGEEGKFLNPLTDICWECVFPITVSGVNITPQHADHVEYNKRFCICPGIPPKVGIPLTFWEPGHLVDVTRHAYKLIGLGGISLGKETVRNRGSVGIIGDSQNSFYHVHWYTYPLFALLDLCIDVGSLEKPDFDLLYMSELDPLWQDDQLALILGAEAALFANPAAQLSCIADCTSSTLMKPEDKLFWCAGCHGSLYPLSGTVAHHVGALQASALLVNRIVAKMHRLGLQQGYEEDEFCSPKFMPLIKKSLYKTQLAYPIPQTQGPCQPLGRSDTLWGAGKSYPHGGEDFVYVLWGKRQCCLNAVPYSIGVGK